MHKYFVSYNFKDRGGSSFGCMEICRSGVFSWEDTLEVSTMIATNLMKTGYASKGVKVIILNWRKYDNPE